MHDEAPARWVRRILGPVELDLLPSGAPAAPATSFRIRTSSGALYKLKCYSTDEKFRVDDSAIRYARAAGVRVPNVVAQNAELRIALFDFVEGVTLQSCLSTAHDERLTLTAVSDVAVQLRRLHDCRPQDVSGLRRLNIASEFAGCVAYLDSTRDGMPDSNWGRNIDALRRSLRGLLPAFDHTAPQSVVHGDLWSPNLIINTTGESTFLDFEWACITTPVLDVARFYGRGLSPRTSGTYTLTPRLDLWRAFADTYYVGDVTDVETAEFQTALLYTALRTLVFYLDLRATSTRADPASVESAISRVAINTSLALDTARALLQR
jgi:aminoglycoside phosphotransferase